MKHTNNNYTSLKFDIAILEHLLVHNVQKKKKKKRKDEKKEKRKDSTKLMINCVFARRPTSLLCIKIALELGEKQV